MLGLQRAHQALRGPTSLRVCGFCSEETSMPCSAAPGSSGAPIPVNKQKGSAEGGGEDA